MFSFCVAEVSGVSWFRKLSCLFEATAVQRSPGRSSSDVCLSFRLGSWSLCGRTRARLPSEGARSAPFRPRRPIAFVAV